MSHCHSRAEESRAKEKGRRRQANFGCMACGVRITIFSAVSPPPRCLFNYHLLQRGRGRKTKGEGTGTGEEKSKGNGGKGGGGRGEVLSDAGDEEVAVKELGRIE